MTHRRGHKSYQEPWIAIALDSLDGTPNSKSLDGMVSKKTLELPRLYSCVYFYLFLFDDVSEFASYQEPSGQSKGRKVITVCMPRQSRLLVSLNVSSLVL